MKKWNGSPELPDSEVDWVMLGRLVGQLDGPINRRPTRAELALALGHGVPVERLARMAGTSGATLRERLGIL